MSTNLAENTTFEEKVTSMFKENIGSLLGDAELKALAEKCIEKVFFKEKFDSYGRATGSCLAEQIISKSLKEIFEKVLIEWMTENTDFVKEKFSEFYSEETIKKCVVASFSNMFAGAMDIHGSKIRCELNEALAQRGRERLF